MLKRVLFAVLVLKASFCSRPRTRKHLSAMSTSASYMLAFVSRREARDFKAEKTN